MEPQNTFIVRFGWRLRDKGDPVTPCWYGRVQHLQSGEGVSFSEVRQLLAFIERYLPSLETQHGENMHKHENESLTSTPPAKPL